MDEKFIISKLVKELEKPSIISPRKKPVSKLKKIMLERDTESEEDSDAHSQMCICSECIPSLTSESIESCTVKDNNSNNNEIESDEENEIVIAET